MLIDDNPDDNFYHERVIKKHFGAGQVSVVVEQSAIDALKYLKLEDLKVGCHPDLVFLDINMPAMNGWEFLEEYNKLDGQFQCTAVVIMLTTSDNPDDIRKAKCLKGVSDLKSKPLTKEMLEDIIEEHFIQ